MEEFPVGRFCGEANLLEIVAAASELQRMRVARFFGMGDIEARGMRHSE